MKKIIVYILESDIAGECVRVAAEIELIGVVENAILSVSMIQDDDEDATPKQQAQDYVECWQQVAADNGLMFENQIDMGEFDKVFGS